MDSIQGYRVPKVQLTHPGTAPGHHLLPSSEPWPALTLFPQTRKLTLDKTPAHRRRETVYPPSLIWLLLRLCWTLHQDCHHRITRTRLPIYDWHVTGVFTVVKISPSPPDLTRDQSHIWWRMPPSLSLCLMHLPLCHSLTTEPVTKTVARHHSCVTKYCYQRPEETRVWLRKEFLWLLLLRSWDIIVIVRRFPHNT